MSRDVDDILGKPVENPSFGTIGISHVQGDSPLFMVDYPTGHYITLKIKAATLRRNLSNDWVYGGDTLIEVAMSEVQWARLISSPNRGDGIPCTLTDYFDPKTGKFVHPRLSDDHAGKAATFANEVRKDAARAAGGVKAALAELDAALAGGPVKKGDLQKIREKLRSAAQDIDSNLPFIVEQAEEAIEKATESGKAEVEAHIDYAMTRLGERALGARLDAVLAAGGDVRAIGEAVAGALSAPTEETQP